MGERKIINKYIPADFDPSLIPRGKKLSRKDGTVPVRMMLPFSVQCDTCHTFLYRGTKFNSKKEAVGGPEGKYLGIQRWRFYIKCSYCARTLSFCTDPKNADYEMESGGTRNYEVYKDKAKTEEESALEKDKEEKEDPMKALENRVLDSQREMADLDNLEEIRAMNRRHLQLLKGAGDGFDADAKAVLAAREAKTIAESEKNLNEHGITNEEEQLVQSIKFGKKSTTNEAIIRLNEEDEKAEEERRKLEVARIKAQQQKLEKAAAESKSKSLPVIRVKRKKPAAPKKPVEKKAKIEPAPAPEPQGLAGLLGGYGSDSDSD